ncbi:DNA-binding transcriptional LysR family regulator [Dyadobacter jejuensis]|uniref:DNA-binding transcriptional LysR family regulator n=1 Tax=Dyadobacter jejuensis TaxID=1082580 RepID=A0A316A993_9BACT|nr:LysR family transcriptional regulator [Dyadobacter jejuensis]PWJ54261.1 DNA-binding transcriptional LysR family regulator [Dyadobacter jejuensis]
MIFDFRLQVFHTAAKRLNFTRAAEELFISQPAITRHVHELEAQLKTKLFDRSGPHLKLTAAGELLLRYSDAIFELYRNLEFEINGLNERHSGKLRLGASTTVAQYILPPILAAFRRQYSEIEVTLMIRNSEDIESALQQKEIDLALIEGYSKNNTIRYTEFLKDEIVLVSRTHNPLAKTGEISPDQLKNIPLLLREPGSGTLEVIARALKDIGLSIADLHHDMQLGSSESMKLYMLHSDSMAFLSVHSVIKELENNECTIVDVTGLTIDRFFYFALPQGQPDALPDLFMKFARR